MSNVLQPRGPLPPRVYWTRRLLLLAVVVVVISLCWVMLAPGGDGSETRSDASGIDETRTSQGPPTDLSTGGVDEPRKYQQGNGQGGDQHGQQTDRPGGNGQGDPDEGEGDPDEGEGDPDEGSGPQQPEKSTEPPEPLPEPSGACDPADVELGIEVSDAAAGAATTAAFSFTSLSLEACTLGLTPDALEIQVTSGSDVLWTSTDCPARVLARQVVARRDPPATYEFTWSGHRSTQNCRGLGETADPGGYWVEAALIGGEPARAYFDVT